MIMNKKHLAMAITTATTIFGLLNDIDSEINLLNFWIFTIMFFISFGLVLFGIKEEIEEIVKLIKEDNDK